MGGRPFGPDAMSIGGWVDGQKILLKPKVFPRLKSSHRKLEPELNMKDNFLTGRFSTGVGAIFDRGANVFWGPIRAPNWPPGAPNSEASSNDDSNLFTLLFFYGAHFYPFFRS